MIALALCVIAFLVCYLAGRRTLGKGIVALMTFGYFYGILRANLLTTYSHFIFDAGMIGLFLSVLGAKYASNQRAGSEAVKLWTILLMAWPALLVLLPFQPLLVSLVGLRANIFFLPLLWMGFRMREKDLMELSTGLAILDLLALAFAGAEYFLGVPRFFPVSPVTSIIYSSGDVEGGFLRIPATFTSAHAFGGTMVATIPFLIGLWTRAERRFQRLLALTAIPLALLGVLMSATRTNFVYGTAMVTFVLFTTKMKTKYRAMFLTVVALVALAALTNVRFQRFKSLKDTDFVAERIAGSVNRDFFEILTEYPMGNGLGGGGSSMPYFLQSAVRHPIGIENEYARILAEQGIIGLLIWLCFLVWFLSNYSVAFAPGPWSTSRRLLWCLAAVTFGTAWIGTGVLSSIPGTVIMIAVMGWTAAPQGREQQVRPIFAPRSQYNRAPGRFLTDRV